MDFSFCLDGITGDCFFSCSDDDDDIIDENLPTVTTEEVKNITTNMATSGGNITDDGGAEVTARGVIWSTSADLTINDNEGITVDGAGEGNFTSDITGLESETQYYVRAYATNSSGTGYGNALAFTTLEEYDNGDDNIVYGNGVTDIDGNEYVTVIIGEQEWMAENLRVSKYNNGDDIPTGLNDAEWSTTLTGTYTINNDDYNMLEAYGKLYNWYAVVDSRGLCPEGWFVPSDADWTTLVNYVVSEGFPNSNDINGAGNALKSCRQVGSPFDGCDTSEHPRWNFIPDWQEDRYGFDEFGFSALPGGRRWDTGGFHNVGVYGLWWSTTEHGDDRALSRYQAWNSGSVQRHGSLKRDGFSVRCFRPIEN